MSTVETDGLWNLSSKQLINDCDFDIIFSKDTVMKKLKKLVHNKSPGPDGINSQLLKELSENIAPSLAVIFQNSYSTGCCPSVWNEANFQMTDNKLFNVIFKDEDSAVLQASIEAMFNWKIELITVFSP